MKFDSLLSDVIATVLGGAILTILLFIAKERLFPLPRLSGQWHFETRTTSTAYVPFSGMLLRYVAMVWQEGSAVHGSFEKVYERSSTGERSYVGKDRSTGTLEGRIEKFYLSKDKVYLHLTEDGVQRRSTIVFELNCDGPNKMSGAFHSTAADQDGRVQWERNAEAGEMQHQPPNGTTDI